MTWLSGNLSRIRLLLVCTVITTVMLPTSSHAVMPDSPASEAAGDPELLTAERLVKEQQFEQSIPFLSRVIGRDPANADAYTYLAFSQRKLGFLNEALGNYLRALDLDPDHISAREYLGELYLQLGERSRAEEQLSRLKLLCPLGCEAREDLTRAIAESSSLQPR